MPSSPLFRRESDSPQQPPAAKRQRFFASDDSESYASSSAPPQAPALVLNSDDDDDDQGRAPSSATLEPAQRPRKSTAPDAADWHSRYFGGPSLLVPSFPPAFHASSLCSILHTEVFVEGFALASSNAFVKLQPGEAITLHRLNPHLAAAANTSSTATAAQQRKKSKKLDNDVVRFLNSKGVEVGRIARDDSAWLAKLLDHDLLDVKGYCVACPDKFRSGDDMQLSLSVSLAKRAFTDPNTAAVEPLSAARHGPNGVGAGAATGGKKQGFLDDLRETDREKLLRERKKALNTLFDKADLQPVVVDGGGAGDPPGSTQSKRAMLSRLEKGRTKGKGKAAGSGSGSEDEEDEMNEIQLNLVCASRAVPLPASGR